METRPVIGGRLSAFTAISAAGWILDILVMLALVAVGTGYFVANFAGALCGVTLVFVFVQKRVFLADGGIVRWRLLLPYLAWQAVAILVASLLVAIAAGLVAEPSSRIAAWSVEVLSAEVVAAGLAKAMVTPITLYSNFLFSGWLMERRISWT